MVKIQLSIKESYRTYILTQHGRKTITLQTSPKSTSKKPLDRKYSRRETELIFRQSNFEVGLYPYKEK